jgi:signal transduction histidine kinase
MQFPTLRARLMAAYTGLIIVGFGLFSILAGRQIAVAAQEDFANSLEAQASLVARALSGPVEHFMEGEARQSDVMDVLRYYADQTGAQLTLIDMTGRAWLTSSGEPPLENLMAYPEIVAASHKHIVREYRQDTSGTRTLYVAAAVVEDGRVLSVVQLAAPTSVVQTSILQRWAVLGGGVLAITLLALAASIVLSTSLTRPLEELRHSVQRVSEGDFSHRLPADRRDEIGHLAAAFNHMAAQVQSMLEEQRAFASNAAHELRTPLTTVLLRTEALQNEAISEATCRQYIREIDDEVRRLSGLVEDLILLSRLDAGRIDLGHEQIDLSRFARRLVGNLTPQAEAQQIKLVLDAPADLPVIQVGLSHLQVVFRNLLDNALKYTSKGGQVTWKLGVQGGHIHSIITDTGHGIAPDDLPHLTQRFYRADRSHTRIVSGVGLGLSLVRSIVEMYGGEVRIDSPGVGKGTSVLVRWPLHLETE